MGISVPHSFYTMQPKHSFGYRQRRVVVCPMAGCEAEYLEYLPLDGGRRRL